MRITLVTLLLRALLARCYGLIGFCIKRLRLIRNGRSSELSAVPASCGRWRGSQRRSLFGKSDCWRARSLDERFGLRRSQEPSLHHPNHANNPTLGWKIKRARAIHRRTFDRLRPLRRSYSPYTLPLVKIRLTCWPRAMSAPMSISASIMLSCPPTTICARRPLAVR